MTACYFKRSVIVILYIYNIAIILRSRLHQLFLHSELNNATPSLNHLHMSGTEVTAAFSRETLFLQQCLLPAHTYIYHTVSSPSVSVWQVLVYPADKTLTHNKHIT